VQSAETGNKKTSSHAKARSREEEQTLSPRGRGGWIASLRNDAVPLRVLAPSREVVFMDSATSLRSAQNDENFFVTFVLFVVKSFSDT
jgi:hypothetical protein